MSLWTRRKREPRYSSDLVNAWRTAAILHEEHANRPRPSTIDEYLSLTAGERNGAVLTSELVSEICEEIQRLRGKK